MKLKLIILFFGLLCIQYGRTVSAQPEINPEEFFDTLNELSFLDKLAEVTSDNIIIKSVPRKIHQNYKQEMKRRLADPTPEEKCAYALGNLTQSYSSAYPWLQMRTFSGADLADLGDRESCNAMEGIARFYVLNIGLKQLPLELRFGMCLPYECTPEIMDHAMSRTSDTMNEALAPALENPPVPLPTDVVPVFRLRMVSPDNWSEENRDERSAAASVFAALAIFLAVMVISGTLYENFARSTVVLTKPKDGFKKGVIQDISEDKATNASQNNITVDNHGSSKRIEGNNINASDVDGTDLSSVYLPLDTINDFISDYSEIHRRPIIPGILSSFSLQVNLNRLVTSRVCNDENDELEMLEGFRVLTMFWGIFCATSLYVLTGHVDNILYMLELFKSITFTMCASGNLSPNLFIFFISFLGFYKIHKYAEEKEGIYPSTYIKLIIYRFVKYTPVFWFIFFFGWAVLPYVSNAPTWYLSETLFADCHKYWWSTMLYFNNLYPWFVEGLNGCFYWPFVVFCDVQLYFFLPLWVLVYRFNKVAFHALMTVLALVGAGVLFYIFWQHKLSVGVLTLENYYLYSINFNKPWTKLPSVALGCWMGAFYLRLLEYRSTPNDTIKEEQYRLIHFIHRSKIALIVLSLYSAAMLNLTTLIPFEVNKDGYAWTRTQNSFYNALCQFGYISSVMAVLVLLFCGWLHIVKGLMSLRIWRPFSRLTLAAYFIYPMIIMKVYVGVNTSVVLSVFNIAFLFLYNLIATYLAALVCYLLIQGPIQNIVILQFMSRFRKFESRSIFETNEKSRKISSASHDGFSKI